MKTWIIIALILSACVVQVEGKFGFVKKIFKGVGKVVGSIVKPVLGIDKFERQTEHGVNSVESGIATFNGNVENSLRNLDTYVKNDIIPEIKKLSDSGTEMAKSAQDMAKRAQELVTEMTEVLIPAALDMMVGITDSTQQVANSTSRLLDTATDVLIPETAQTLNTSRWMMIQFVNITQGIQQRIGQSLDNVDYILELSIALIFMALGALCGYEIRRVGYTLRPRGLAVCEIYLLKWSRIVCFASALLLAIHIILRVLQISIISIPERRNFFFLFPISCVALYYIIKLLIKLFKLLYIGCFYLSFVIRYLLFPFYTVLYYVFFSPFVLTYRCFTNRHRHSDGIGAFVIYSMPVFFCVFYSGCEEILDTYLLATEKKNSLTDYSLTWLYSLMICYVLFHIIAIGLWFRYPPYSEPLFLAELNRRLRTRQMR